MAPLYVETLRRRDRALREERVRRAEEMRARLPDLTRALVEEFHATRVVLFGSLLGGELRERSDVDLAVAGLEPPGYFHALARLSEIAGAPVDLVPPEESAPSLRARIEAEGEVLHDVLARLADRLA